MKAKRNIIFAAVLALIALVTLASPMTAWSHEDENGGKIQYTCGMHPEIISDEPGYCPICGMKLTPKKGSTASTPGAVTIDPTTRQNMGLVTRPVMHGEITKSIRAFGKVDYSEPKIYEVNLKISGWAEKLFVDREGDRVSKGQPMVEIYSPDLVAAQRELLIANKSNTENSMTGLLESAKMRLKNWGIDDDQIETLLNTGEVKRTMVMRAPATGIVTEKNVAEGDYLKRGARLYRVANLSSVWVVAQIYEQDLPFVKLGQKATVRFPNVPGDKYEATVSYISPFLNSKGQVEIRLDLINNNNQLKPEMYAEVNLHSVTDGNKMIIPLSAIINSGAKQLAYVSAGEGEFLPRVITTGLIGDNDMVEVRSGLKSDDQVVTSGQFMLDSETRLNEALAMGDNSQQHNHGQMDMKSDSAPAPETKKMTGHATDKGMQMESAADSLSGIYTCPMPQHFHVLRYGPGKCPECGMNLVPVEQTKNNEVYYCPMSQCQVVQSEPGRCPTCGMYLKKLGGDETGTKNMKQPDQEKSTEMKMTGAMKHDEQEHTETDSTLSGIYTCPMPQHYNVLQYGPGKCSECGMNLVPVEQTDNDSFYYCPMSQCQVVQAEPGNCSVCGMKLMKYEPETGHDQ